MSEERQKLYDLHHLINKEIGAYLVLKEEGSEEQRTSAHLAAKSSLTKFAPEMQKAAAKIGERCSFAATAYLQSADTILHAAIGWIDEAKISNYFHANERLEKEIHLPKAA
jgi:hypothetical protein